MAVIKWLKQAWSLFNQYVDHARIEYGDKTDTVYIRDVWDTKMNPISLRNRLK